MRDHLRWLTARPIAHRGLHDLARGRPENSLAAFEAALDARYAIECDLHISADGIPIVFHDDELDRLTNATGCVRDRTAAELGALRLADTRERIPTLDELLRLADGRVPLVIELKHLFGRDVGFARAVAERLKIYDGPVALMSFDIGLIGDMRTAAPSIPRGLIAYGGWTTALAQLSALLRLKIDFVSYAIDDLPTAAPVFARRALGLPLICWTVRNPEQRRKADAWTDQITFEGFTP